MKKEEKTLQDKFLQFVYTHSITRIMLKPFVSPFFSRLGGAFLDSKLSKLFIKPFIKISGIDMSEYEKVKYNSYNDFFKRRIKPEARCFSDNKFDFISPCDSRLSVYDINETSKFYIKNTPYTVRSLCRSRKISDYYKGGKVWVFRLCVDDYHRYMYTLDGTKSNNKYIHGSFHTVNPIANDYFPIYKENAREYCIINNKYAGHVLMMEVGALLVGKIENKHIYKKSVNRGEEKGNFAFGGSTIVMITKKDAVTPRKDVVHNSKNNIETRVKQGEIVGYI